MKKIKIDLDLEEVLDDEELDVVIEKIIQEIGKQVYHKLMWDFEYNRDDMFNKIINEVLGLLGPEKDKIVEKIVNKVSKSIITSKKMKDFKKELENDK